MISLFSIFDWLVSSWSFKHHQYSGFNASEVYVPVISSFHLVGSASCKTIQECLSDIYIFQGIGNSEILEYG